MYKQEAVGNNHSECWRVFHHLTTIHQVLGSDAGFEAELHTTGHGKRIKSGYVAGATDAQHRWPKTGPKEAFSLGGGFRTDVGK
uniref:Uncharacterized protein n=1 Tax=Bracon brevicornis TaxID=1563983 RepID=A0A6V7LXE1_9HYME